MAVLGVMQPSEINFIHSSSAGYPSDYKAGTLLPPKRGYGSECASNFRKCPVRKETSPFVHKTLGPNTEEDTRDPCLQDFTEERCSSSSNNPSSTVDSEIGKASFLTKQTTGLV